ncbi:MAG: glycosyltransferase [Methanobacteriota archaeon]|nr:MAG: glycosyltransferase [Euryarchaeota archaeon]
MQRLNRYWSYFDAIRKKVGFWGAMKYALKRVLSRKALPSSMTSKPNPVEFYRFIYSSPFGECSVLDARMIINWVIPDFGIGSGGHLNIFRVVKKLEEKGFICRIIIDGETHFSSGGEARECIRKNFFPIDAEVFLGREELRPAAATFATGWTTAYTVRDFMASGTKYYFVQDFEPYFYPPGSEYRFAEETYRFGFVGITAGDWLAKKLATEYGMRTIPFRFSYDRETYKPHPRREPHVKRVFFYARPVTARRAFELGLLTLAMIHERKPDIEFVMAGWDLSGYEIPFPFLNAGVLPLSELPDLYSQCDVALVLSFTNVSLLPLEVMACNCAVVSNKGPNVEWLLNDNVARLSDATPEALSNAIIELIEDNSELDRLKKNGLAFARSTNWDEEVEKIVNEITKGLSR